MIWKGVTVDADVHVSTSTKLMRVKIVYAISLNKINLTLVQVNLTM